MAVITSKQIVLPIVPISVTITTGTLGGNETYCNATINGVKYYSAVSDIEVRSGDSIIFALSGVDMMNINGYVKIDGVQVFTATQTNQVSTYTWKVPTGITSITINLDYATSSSSPIGRITVTTT